MDDARELATIQRFQEKVREIFADAILSPSIVELLLENMVSQVYYSAVIDSLLWQAEEHQREKMANGKPRNT